jgi:predicted ATPase
VLLDNLEQLSQSGAAHLQELRERLPQATFMVTSRALLHLPGEREFSVMPLPTPLESADADELTTTQCALFCDRAGLNLTPANSDAIGALCRRLDGIPLALELAAARARVLSPAQIVERCSNASTFCRDVKWAWRRAIARCAPPSSGAPIYWSRTCATSSRACPSSRRLDARSC